MTSVQPSMVTAWNSETIELPSGAGVVAVHACGLVTDIALAASFRAGGPVAVMPCCHTSARRHGIAGLRDAIGTRLAVDVDRTYRMEAAGLRVEWTAIPARITPMNRIMIGLPR